MQRSKISISHHARLRLAERVPEIHPNNYNTFVSSARYNGKSLSELMQSNPRIGKYIYKTFKYDNSTRIKWYQNHAFVFRGNNAHTLVTVVNISM